MKDDRLCILHTSLHEKLIRDLHNGGLKGLGGRDKIMSALLDKYYKPKIAKE
jgi:hypothetical protein